MDRKEIEFINKQNDIEYQKYRLKRKLRKREKTLRKRFNEVKEQNRPKNLVFNIAEGLGADGDLFNTLIPILVRYGKQLSRADLFKQVKKSPRSSLLVLSAGLSLGLLSYLLFKSKKMKEEYFPEDHNQYD
jgi:hypothetical protein